MLRIDSAPIRVLLLVAPTAIGITFHSSFAEAQSSSHASGVGDASTVHDGAHGNERRTDAALTRAVRSPSPTTARQTFTGQVSFPDGAPAAGAVVVTDAGGQAITAADGSFELELDLPIDAESVHVTAIAGASGPRSLVASARAPSRPQPGTTTVGRLALAATANCQPSWLPTFGGEPGTTLFVHALAVFDDGGGPALYAGGIFISAGGVAASRIAKWDGSSWSPLGSGVNGNVYALQVFDDGSGSALHAGGVFTVAGGVAANCIAKWNGSSWSALGSGMTGAPSATVHALTVFDDGSGPALVAGGSFTSAGGMAASNIAKWNGSSWSALGSGMTGGPSAAVHTLAVFDDGSGPALVTGGSFTSAGGMAASNIAKWNGSSWSALASGTNSSVYALTAFDDGGGPALYVGGAFTSADSIAADRIAKWDGSIWSALGIWVAGAAPVMRAITVFDDGSGPALYAGGEIAPGATAPNHIAKWDGSSWSVLGSGMNRDVHALAVFDDGSGPALHAGGEFTTAGAKPAKFIARWDGSGWTALGSGVDREIYALTVFDDGSGPSLFVGGNFTSAGGIAINRIAKWDGSSWSPLGSGMDSAVYTLTTFDDGGGAALYAGGSFFSAGGISANRVAKWDGSAWSPLGTGMNSTVESLAAFDDGSGPALYAGGWFTSAGGIPASRIAKWDGATWSPLGSGIGGVPNLFVAALAVFDDGTGPALYVGGEFWFAGGIAASCIARWNGSSWSALGSGTNTGVFAITVFDDGSGPALYAGGWFSSAGGAPAARIAKWSGASWSALASGIPVIAGTFQRVDALAVFDDGNAPALYVGGNFSASPAGDSYLAKWGCAAIASLPGCAGNPAKLAALAPSAPLGVPLPLRITGAAATSGLGLIYFGASGLDASSCGLHLPGLGELLLALVPPPALMASAPLASGSSSLSVSVPSDPGLNGVTTYLQGVAVDFVLANPIELTNGLAVKLGP